MPTLSQENRLKKTLGLFDVYAIATGAMFSAEFFLLAGIAMTYTGPSVWLAYLLSGVLVLPAMFSQAELATAMPRAGGTYYFIDRALGPMVGTVGGLGTWLSLVFKSAFALIGMGAYFVLFLDMPIQPVAVALTVAFTILNVIGAEETSGLQRFLVITLLGILALFLAQGLVEVFGMGVEVDGGERFDSFLSSGIGGLVSAIGLVFAAYAGLTKVASVSEEVINPDRNVPLGMIFSLSTAVCVYTVGVFLLVAVLDPADLVNNLTAFATAADQWLGWIPTPGWLPRSTGVLLIVIAAMAAFASTGNAGILSASRYPLAMARDRLITRRFDKINRFDTPAPAIWLTGAAMILFIVLFNVEGIAKLASAFNLLVFGLINLAVIVMRESHIASYAPAFRTPLYPWMQIAGILITVVLIILIGWISILFTVGIIAACIGWYFYYARNNPDVEREGAVYHLFERLGRHRYGGLDEELSAILEEKGLSEDAPFNRMVAHAPVLDLDEAVSYEALVRRATDHLSRRVGMLSGETLAARFLENNPSGQVIVSHGASLPHYRIAGIEQPELALVRCRPGLCIELDGADGERTEPIYAFFLLVSPEDYPSRHLRALANIASRVDEAQFLDEWRAAEDEQQLKEVLLHHDRYVSLHVQPDARTANFTGRAIRDLNLPGRTLVALVRRNGEIIVPSGSTVIEEDDRLTVIGEPAGIRRLYELYRR